MKWFLNILFISTIKTVYSKSIELPQQNDSREVNKFLGKVLHANKFNELADRIADRAVMKLKDYQEPQFTGKSIATKGGAFRPRMKTLLQDAINYSYDKSRGQGKHKHGKIDVDAVLMKTVSPLSDLKLRYEYLKNIHSKPALHIKITNKNEDEEHEGGENTPQNYMKPSQNIQSDLNNNIKTVSDENVKNPYGQGETVSWDMIHSNEETKLRTDSQQIGDSVSSEKRSAYSGTTRTEGDKQFALNESPDYKDYHELLSKMGI